MRLFLYVTIINIYNDETELERDIHTNLIYLEGYLCKKPIFRKTPLGKRITDLLIAVNRPYGKSDYIPCITWGKVAKYTSELEVGTKVVFYGRIQSRDYFKRYSPDSEEGEYKTVYEISIMDLKKVED